MPEVLLRLALFVATGVSKTVLVSAGVFVEPLGGVLLAFSATDALKDNGPAVSQQALSLLQAFDPFATGLSSPTFAVDQGIVA